MLHVRSQRPAFPSKINRNLQLDRLSPIGQVAFATFIRVALGIHRAAKLKIAPLAPLRTR